MKVSHSPLYWGGKKGGVGGRHDLLRSCVLSGAGTGAPCWLPSGSQFRHLWLLPSELVFLPSSQLGDAGVGHLPHLWVCRRGKGLPGFQQRFILHNMEMYSIHSSHKTMSYILLTLLLKILMKTAI